MGAVPVMASQAYRYRTWWLALGWLGVAVVLVLSLVPLSGDLPEGSDKLSHFAVYGVLTFWFGMLHPGWRRQAVVALGFVAMGVCIEFLQGLTSYRSFEVADMIANTIGVGLGLGVVQTPLRHLLVWFEARLQ
jgi:VanZ family protein